MNADIVVTRTGLLRWEWLAIYSRFEFGYNAHGGFAMTRWGARRQARKALKR